MTSSITMLLHSINTVKYLLIELEYLLLTIGLMTVILNLLFNFLAL